MHKLAVKQTTPPDETPDAISKKLRRSIERDQQAFKNLLDENAPDLDKEEIFASFNNRASNVSRKLVDLASNALAFVNATFYANLMLKDALNAEDTAFDISDVTKELTKIIKLKLVKLICREFKIDRNYEKQVIYNIIDAEFSKSGKVGVLHAPAQPIASNRPNQAQQTPQRPRKTR